MVLGIQRVVFLSFNACLVALTLGFDTGLMSVVNVYIRQEFVDEQLSDWLASSTVIATIFGCIIGAYLNDTFGRKKAIMLADMFLVIGALVVAVLGRNIWIILMGRILFGIGQGLSFLSCPLYISEWSPARMRGRLVSMVGMMLTIGSLGLFYYTQILIKHTGSWRLLVGLEAFPPMIQLLFICFFPESPIWLRRHNKDAESIEAVLEIHHLDDVGQVLEMLRHLNPHQSFLTTVMDAFGSAAFGRAVLIDIIVQVTQHFVGMNVISYANELIEDESKLSASKQFIISFLPHLGTILTTFVVDRFGRRVTLMMSLLSVTISLFMLSVIFGSAQLAPQVEGYDSKSFGTNGTCPVYSLSSNPSSWNCLTCLTEKCGFCANKINQLPGACLVNEEALENMCTTRGREWHINACSSQLSFYIVGFLEFYTISHSLGLESIPYVLNVEIFPSPFLGLGAGIGGTVNWFANLMSSMMYEWLLQKYGWPATYVLYGVFSTVSLISIFYLLPETQGQNLREYLEDV